MLYAASDFAVMTVVVLLLVVLDGIHHRAGGPFSGPGHADAPRELPELQVSSSTYLAAHSSRSATPVRAIPTTSASAVQPRIKLSVQLAVVLLWNARGSLLSGVFYPACCSLGCTL